MIRKSKVAKAIQYSLLLSSMAIAPGALAQAEDLLEEETLEEEPVEKVVITGSRIRRAEFSSASPIQVIDGEVSRELGLFNAEDMLQTSTQASGLQIDNSFGGFVLDNGPGSSTIGFRGLGAARTLVLMNGRRIAPAGVGGAPVAADLNLIPGVMIDRVENLFDGASTVYGSDAIAGVANIILRQDVEGFEFEGSYSNPEAGGGEEEIFSLMYGKTSDKWSFTIGAEYNNQRRQSIAQNAFTGECTELHYEDEQGNILSEYRGLAPSALPDDACDIFPLTNRVFFNNFYGSLYYTPGSTNTGIDNFTETGIPFSLVGFHPSWIAVDDNGDGIADAGIVDGNGDGLQDISFKDPFYAYGRSDYYRSGDFISANKRYSVMVNGDYSFGDDNDTRAFFEGLYAKRNSDSFSPGGQFFPVVPASNPYNPCGIYAEQDCLSFLGVQGGRVLAQPILNIRGDRDQSDVDVSQYRLLAGLEGNIGALDDLGMGNWVYEVHAAYSSSTGENTIQGVHRGRLSNSLNTSVLNDDGSITCGNGSDGCVPVNLFAPNIYQEGGGTFTDAEAAYLFTDRYMETKVKQTMFSGFITGDLLSLPWNDEIVPIVLGAEFRKDEIESNPNEATSEGLIQHYFSDKGADGSRNLREIFTEFELPLVRGHKFAEELTVTASGRWTDESYYDPATTYSLKTVYRPVEWFTLRGTKGTSYRAPNLRERFLNGTTGFNDVTDPCVVPTAARDGDPLDPNALPTYNAGNDTRQQRVLNACIANGVDPTSLGIGSAQNTYTPQVNVEISTGGSETLSEENSTAKTWGLVFEQPFSDAFDLTLSATWYDIEIVNAVVEPGNQYIVDQCYDNPDIPDGSSGFCSRITREANGDMTLLDASFINAGLETSRGIDYNVYYSQDFIVGEKTLGVTFDLLATNMKEQMFDILGSVDDNVGEPAFPEWRANSRLSLEYSDFRVSWITRFIQGGELDDPEEFDPTNAACDGLNIGCRPVPYTEDYYRHDVAVNYTQDNYSVTFGIRNVFDEAPSKADDDGVFSVHNIPLGIGYDLFGRTAYLNFGMNF
ncbi:TonB-dependent receptor [Lacimicrobium sp. SS2-24]|uniref:TonB-dependent receptor domain-containing protein n=1 Tax=Lacimicrobium sp. SS2-24 TaxID=2005569 RepID=UPI000B4B3C46|nr:TonB-dependent receptor [Lacimicrobium sp. SS2-24]